jgi:hypothetical protein
MRKNKEKIDFWDELTKFQKEEIEQGIKDLDEGRCISWEILRRSFQN